MKKISKAELTKKLKRLSGWKMVKGRSAITKTYEFNNFQSKIYLNINLYIKNYIFTK